VHISRFLPSAVCIAAALALFGCKGQLGSLQTTCNDLLETSKMIDNCPGMAKRFSTQSKAFHTQFDAFQNIKDEARQEAYRDTLSICIQAMLEITMGPCKNDPGILATVEELSFSAKQKTP